MSEVIEQGTEAWHAVRVGRITGSRVYDLVATMKRGGYTAKRADMILELACERMTGIREDVYVTPAMRWGAEQEPYAKIAYAWHTGIEVLPAPFIPHPHLPMCGASPDGYAGEQGLVEIKCPKTRTHIQTILSGEVPEQYLPQIHLEMDCAGAEWVDFVSFDPRMPEHGKLWIKRVPRDEEYLSRLRSEIVKAEEEIQETIAKILEVTK